MPFSKVFIIVGCCLMFSSCSFDDESGSAFGERVRSLDLLNVDVSEVELMPEKGLVYYQNEPFTGTSAENYPDGKIAHSISYVKGKKHGWEKKYFDDGKISYSSLFEHGKQHGKVSTWWRNGNIRSKSNLIHGIPEGEQLQWYASGVLFKKMNLVNGKEEGLQQSWRENGKLYNNYEAKNGRIFGLKRASLCFSLKNEVVQDER